MYTYTPAVQVCRAFIPAQIGSISIYSAHEHVTPELFLHQERSGLTLTL